MDPDWLLTEFGSSLHLVEPRHRLHRVRAVLPVPARRHPALRARASSSPASRSTSSASARRSSSWCVAIVLLTVAAVLGNVVGYEIGRAHRATALQPRRPDPQAEVLRQDAGVLRQARQQGAGHRPVRAVRADLHHRRRRRDPDGPAPVLRLEPGRRGAVGRRRSRCSATSSATSRGRPVPGREHRLRDPGDPALHRGPDRLRVRSSTAGNDHGRARRTPAARRPTADAPGRSSARGLRPAAPW